MRRKPSAHVSYIHTTMYVVGTCIVLSVAGTTALNSRCNSGTSQPIGYWCHVSCSALMGLCRGRHAEEPQNAPQIDVVCDMCIPAPSGLLAGYLTSSVYGIRSIMHVLPSAGYRRPHGPLSILQYSVDTLSTERLDTRQNVRAESVLPAYSTTRASIRQSSPLFGVSGKKAFGYRRWVVTEYYSYVGALVVGC